MKKISAQIEPENSYRFLQDERDSFIPVVLVCLFLAPFVFPMPACAAGKIVAWGQHDAGQCDVQSPNSGFTAISAGGGAVSLGLQGGSNPAPVITAFSPIYGAMGGSVTISGLNFSPVAADNIVYFGAVRAVVTAASATNLTVTVPAGAIYAPITVTVNGLTAYANQSFMPTFSGDGSSITVNSFAPRLDLASGSGPIKVVIADLDGDGKPDLIVANDYGNTISLYRNISTNGSLTAGSFAPRVDLVTPPGNNSLYSPFGLAVADVDGDGKLDIIVTDYDDSIVSVYRNTCTPGNISSNSFATRVDFATGAQPQGVAVADIDGDGKPDLLVANHGDGTVSILRNTSVMGSLTTNSFALKVDIATGSGCDSVAVGDLYGDGKPDVVTANTGSGTVSLLRNISTPGSITTNSFAAPVDIAVLSEPIEVAIGDLDGDGKLDLIVTFYFPQTIVSVLRNTSTAGSLTTASFAPRIDFSLGGRGHTPAIADLDGDGKPDLAVVTELNSLLSIFHNVSTPGSFTTNSFAPRVDFATGYNAWGVAIGDLDGDGRPDIVFANTYDNTISIYQNVTPFGNPPIIATQPTNQTVVAGGTTTFSVTVTGRPPFYFQWQKNGTNLTDGGNISGSASFSVTAGGTLPLSHQWNFNGTNIDGATNSLLVLTNVQFSQAGNYAVLVTNLYGSVMSSNAVLTVVPPPPVPVITGLSPASGLAGISVTIFGINFSPVTASNIVYFGAVRAVVTTASVTNLTVTVPVGATYAPITVTVNGLTAWANAPFLPTYLGSGTINSSSLEPRLDLPAGNGPTQIAIGDLDGDGKPDLVVGNSYDSTVWVYRNISTNGTLAAASFAPAIVLPVVGSGSGNNVWVALADLVGDGRLDIVACNGGYNSVSVFKNLSLPGSITTNSFGSRVDFSVAGLPNSVAVMDLDGDGKPEIITANYAGNTVAVLRNIGINGTITTNSFAAPVYFPAGPAPNQVAIADLDGDGKPDIVTANTLPFTLDTNNAVSVLRNISTVGNIAFASTVNFPGVPTSCNLAIGDLDGDGKLDLIVSSFINGQAVSVYRNVSTRGSITTNSFAPHVDFAVGGWGNDVAIVDLDGDGKPDVAVVTQLPDHLSLFKNISIPGSFTTNSFAPRVDFTAGYNPNGVAIGDLDGDGRPDIVFGNSYDNTISIYRNIVPFGRPPVITTQPTSQTVTVGNSASFSVTASGTLPLDYQWNFNRTNIPGATNSMLTLTNVKVSQAGNYAVLVTNAFGSILSSNAVLRINRPPVADATATVPLVISCNNSNARMVLNGSRSSDPEGRPLQYFWFEAGATNVIAARAVAVVVLPVGTNSITLMVNDGFASSQQTITVAVITIPQAIDRLTGLVMARVAKPQPLIASLSAALASVERGNRTAAIQQLQAFQHKVDAQVARRNPALARTLVKGAEEIIYALECGRDGDGRGPGCEHGRIEAKDGRDHGGLSLEFSGTPGTVYIIEASTNLVNWATIGAATADENGNVSFTDAEADRHPARFYRVLVE
jgi:hypothetical protein